MNTSDGFSFDVERPRQLSRLLIFLKWLFVLPHTFILGIYGWAVGIIAMLAWFIILFTGQYPAVLWDFVWLYVKWTTRINIYTYLLRDEYPPFGDGPYPMQLTLARTGQSSRMLALGRVVLLIPLMLWLIVVGCVQLVLVVYAWVMILISGTIPAGTFDYLVGILRYITRVSCYALMLTDTWPGFSVSENRVRLQRT